MATLERVVIEDFQSLKHANLELGKLTVIVGASNSGKSAVVRALQLLVSNASGKSYVRRGRPTCHVGVYFAESTGQGLQGLLNPSVWIHRGRDNFYAYATRADTEPERWTKVGTGVPEEITKLLGIDPSDPPNFAGQFDRPYLLDESGATVARIIGNLTNVTTVMEAAREANRRGLEVSRAQRSAAEQIQKLDAKLPEFNDLPKEADLLAVVHGGIQEIDDLERKVTNLGGLIRRLDVEQAALLALTVIPKTPAGLAEAEGLRDQLNRLLELIGKVTLLEQQNLAAREQRGNLREVAAGATAERLRTLKEAGVCPTCEQVIEESHAH